MTRSLASLVLLWLAACGTGTITGDDDPDAGVEPDAAVICVPTGNEVHGDGKDNDCDGIVDELEVCHDGSESFTTLAAGIAAAPDGGGIEVCAGTYRERLSITGKSVRINGAGAAVTTLDAGGAGPALDVSGGHDVIIAGFTITNAHAQTGGGAVRCTGSGITVLDSAVVGNESEAGGGGLHATGCRVTLDDVRFEGNEGHAQGGAVDLVNSTGTIVDSRFTGNSADYGGAVALTEGAVNILSSQLEGNTARVRGGALYQASDGFVQDSSLSGNQSSWIGGAVYVLGHMPTFRRNQIINNVADWEGGGLYLHQTEGVFEDNTIAGNQSYDDGGGLRIFESAGRFERNVISSNHAIDGDGGGFKCSHVASVFIDNVITDNRALGAGGGVELDNDSSHLRGGVISGNRASIGGGVHVMLWPWHGGLIEDVRIADNRAWRGGGMYLENNFQAVTIRRVTVTGNHAHQGAGIYTRGTPLRLSNATIVDNDASDVGGAFFVHPSSAYPWTRECPCPPIDPPAQISFVVAHGNVADAGAAAYIGAPNLSFRNSIFSGHAGTAVVVTPMTPSPSWSYNNTYPATFDGMSGGGSGNFSADPGFAAASAGDFRLAGGSACIDAGDPSMTDRDGSRADLGVFGGPDAP